MKIPVVRPSLNHKENSFLFPPKIAAQLCLWRCRLPLLKNWSLKGKNRTDKWVASFGASYCIGLLSQKHTALTNNLMVTSPKRQYQTFRIGEEKLVATL